MLGLRDWWPLQKLHSIHILGVEFLLIVFAELNGDIWKITKLGV